MKVSTGLSIDEATLIRIDQLRGEVPRSRILERLINTGLRVENEILAGGGRS